MELNIKMFFSFAYSMLVLKVLVSIIKNELNQKEDRIRSVKSLFSRKQRRIVFNYSRESACGDSWSSSSFKERKLVVLGRL